MPCPFLLAPRLFKSSVFRYEKREKETYEPDY